MTDQQAARPLEDDDDGPVLDLVISAVPRAKIAASREEDATPERPMVYREHALVVAEGTTEAEAERILRAHFWRLREALANTASAKLVRLAAFDVDFTGSPPGPPVATLTWKSWRDDVMVTFPRSVGSAQSGMRLAPPPFAEEPAAPRVEADANTDDGAKPPPDDVLTSSQGLVLDPKKILARAP